MKTVVLLNDLTMSDVVGNTYYQQYTDLLEKDILKYFFSNPSTLQPVSCPGCLQSPGRDVYARLGMNFKLCDACGSYFVSPRPTPKALEAFYQNSSACQYWRKQISELPDSQLQNIYGSRIHWIQELADEFLKETALCVDFETKYPFLLRQLWTEKTFREFGTLKPQLFEQTNLLSKDILVGYTPDQFENQANMVTAFETLERMSDPRELFSIARQCCKKGGLFLITTSTSSGFEYQILKEHAPNINPINRMNLLSLEAITNQIQAAGFEILELSTPGRLDVEIVNRAIGDSKDLKIDPFWMYVFKHREEKTLQSLQDFLQANRLSSHLRIAARKT